MLACLISGKGSSLGCLLVLSSFVRETEKFLPPCLGTPAPLSETPMTSSNFDGSQEALYLMSQSVIFLCNLYSTSSTVLTKVTGLGWMGQWLAVLTAMRTQIWFHTPGWTLSTVCNYSFRGLMPSSGFCRIALHAHKHTLPMHIIKNKSRIFKHSFKIKRKVTRSPFQTSSSSCKLSQRQLTFRNLPNESIIQPLES